MKKTFLNTLKNMFLAFPMIFGILLLINLLNPILQKHYETIFNGNYLIDPFIGAILGSISFGIPIISYITGWELLKNGVSLIAVLTFILTWSTVGLAMLPLESRYLGKKFSLLRNIFNFFTAIIIAILTVLTLNILGLNI